MEIYNAFIQSNPLYSTDICKIAIKSISFDHATGTFLCVHHLILVLNSPHFFTATITLFFLQKATTIIPDCKPRIISLSSNQLLTPYLSDYFSQVCLAISITFNPQTAVKFQSSICDKYLLYLVYRRVQLTELV